jgi:hypothetical protein
VVEPPTVTVWDEGATEIEKSVTTRLVVAEWASVPLVPVTVSVEVAAAAVPSVVTVSVEVPLPVIVVDEKLGEAPVGKPVALKVTVPVNPFKAPMVTV